MADTLPPLTPKQKLALSRAELLEAMGYFDIAPSDATAPQLVSTRFPRADPVPRPTSRRGVLARWWSRHPLNSVADLGRPFLEDMARRQPAKLMACGAGTGALLMVIKPWKLLSLATVLSLAFRTSDLTGLMAGAFARPDDNDDPPADEQVPLQQRVS
ncbi:hypothetical protein [Variovorax sp. N23]|uniref:hypothetical protein n=1 Tax=Variovorax sp. N23 TaxID=2980555 RepID=UPI0021C8CE3A|nr:hypothetical protein [Variovorax sp. N23]MCU4117832.1 hypothetical protein [Variovorax sp. N23]